MHIKIKLEYRKWDLRLFIYHIPAWLAGAIIVIILLIWLFLKILFIPKSEIMRIEDFTVHFKKQKKSLYSYFLKMIREKTPYRGDLHPLVRDYLDLTFTEAYYKVLSGQLSELPVDHIIRIKARDVFINSIRKSKKFTIEDISPVVFEKASSDPDPYQRLVLQEDMKTLDSLLTDAARQLFENIADQVPGRVIADNLDISLTALTSRISRLRKLIQQHLEKGY